MQNPHPLITASDPMDSSIPIITASDPMNSSIAIILKQATPWRQTSPSTQSKRPRSQNDPMKFIISTEPWVLPWVGPNYLLEWRTGESLESQLPARSTVRWTPTCRNDTRRSRSHSRHRNHPHPTFKQMQNPTTVTAEVILLTRSQWPQLCPLQTISLTLLYLYHYVHRNAWKTKQTKTG